jgi:hypothetical protein
MTFNKTMNLRLVMFAILVLVFWNTFWPDAKELFNFMNPSSSIQNVDFYAYYRGGRTYLSGIQPYSGTSDGQPFIYPPTFIPLYAQIAKLDYASARTLWLGIYSTCFLVCLALLVLKVGPSERDKTIFLALLIVLLSFPVRIYIRQGQIDIIVASFCFASLLLYLFKHHNLSAICLAVATLTKLNPVIFMITFFVFLQDWKYLLRFSLAVAGLVALSLCFFPLDWYRAFFTDVIPTLTGGDTHPYNQSLIRFFVDNPNLAHLVTLAGGSLFTILAGLLGLRHRQQIAWLRNGKITPFNQFLAVAVFFCNGLVSALFSGSTWIMTYTWFILPAVWLLVITYQQARYWLVGILALGIAMLQSIVISDPVVKYVSIEGALLCLITLLLVGFFPRLSFDQSAEWLGETASAE